MTAATWFRLGAILAFLGVSAGAFGAHGLERQFSTTDSTRPTPEGQVAPARRLEVFKTGAQYQMYHAFGLLALGLLLARTPGPAGPAALVAGGSFVLGILLFSGSLYAIALTGQSWLGRITPFGGVAFLIGWLALAAVSWSKLDPSV